MRRLALAVFALGLAVPASAQPVASLQTLQVECLASEMRCQHAPPAPLDGDPVSSAPRRAGGAETDAVEVAVWGAMVVASVGVAVAGWRLAAEGLRVEPDSEADRAARAVVVGMGLALAVPATAGAGYAGYRLVVALR